MGKKGPDAAPKIEYLEWEDRKGNIHQVAKGIDPGWDYNVGQGNNIMKGADENA